MHTSAILGSGQGNCKAVSCTAGASVPTQLQPALVAAAGNMMRVCAGMEHTAQGDQEWTDSGALQPYAHTILLDAVVTDPVLRHVPGCTELRAEHPGQVHPRGTAGWHWQQYAMTILCKWMYHHNVQIAPHAAHGRHMMLRVLVVLRGTGLLASPYGAKHAQAAVEALMCGLATEDMLACVQSRAALCMLRLQTVESAPSADPDITPEYAAQQRASTSLQGPHRERYAACPKRWEYRPIVGAPSARISGADPTPAAVVAELRRRRANCLPVLLDWHVTEELIMQAPAFQRIKFRQPRRYRDICGWALAEVPSFMQGLPVADGDAFLQATLVHAKAEIEGAPAATRAVGLAVMGAAQAGDARQNEPASLPLQAFLAA